MLSHLSIENYAIIQQLEVDFNNDFCVITGETGAGKSIIMGALSLILGQRADTTVLNSNNSKCIVEGRFLVSQNTKLQNYFEQNDLDYDEFILLRREITPSGKSRAFINDTPVQLAIIRELGLQLIDIHSQHSNLELGKKQFQLNVIDWYAGNNVLLEEYSTEYKQLRIFDKEYKKVIAESEQAKADLDYFEYQFNQLYEANLQADEQAELEKEQEILNHSEDIKAGLSQVYQLLDGEEFAALSKLKETVQIMQKLSAYMKQAEDLSERLNSQYLEMQDIANECEMLSEKTENNPDRLDEITSRLNLLYDLQQKHRVSTVSGLIEIREDFDLKIQTASSYDNQILKLESQIQNSKVGLTKLAVQLNESRKSVLSNLEKQITSYLSQLGMPNADFKADLKTTDDFQANGTDEMNFLFAANKGSRLEEITRVASGGEMSRLMLAIKTVVAKSKALPAIIFDEIDNGISGEIAGKMGTILKDMANYMQVINITHLPQIASKGDSHYLVYKNDTSDNVETGMRMLNSDERIDEIAKMLSGENPTDAAIENAKSLLIQ
ncbi:MAG: DNA repair protein RecN [Prolixibacteraceae bacterium]|jgi:DNA repair protein RecN (Recombination protein N)|nr:DNA repair protein RecN [Prolixibacteraceae bacterium]